MVYDLVTDCYRIGFTSFILKRGSLVVIFLTQIRISRITPVETDQEKVQSTLKQFVRDWSTEGCEERKVCYQPIVDEIINQFPKHL